MSEGFRESLPESSAAPGLAAFRLAQKLTSYLIESGLLPAEHAVAMIRDAAQSEKAVMDDTWSPDNEAAGHLLELLAKALERKHLGK